MPSVTLTLPSAGTVITAALHSTNYTTLQTLLNGGLDAANWGSGQIFAPSKIAQEGASTGQFMKWDGSKWGPATISVATPNYATSLPGSPSDGQEAILVDSITNPTYQWRFRYNAGSALTDKWECIGGAPALVEVATAETLPSAGAYVALSTVGPSFTVPRAGVYHVEIGAKFNPGAAAHTGRMSYDIGGTGAVDADSTYEGTGSGDQYGSSVMRAKQKAGLAASTALVSKYKATATSDGFEFRWMRVLPLRVS